MQSKITSRKPEIIAVIRRIADEAKDSKLSKEHFIKIDKDLRQLSKYLKVSKTQAYLVSVIFSLGYCEKNLDFRDISRYLNCNPITLLELKSDFDFLMNNGHFQIRYNMNSSDLPMANYTFSISKELSEAIVNEKPVAKKLGEAKSDLFTLLEKIFDLGMERFSEDIPSFILAENVKKIVDSNSNIPFFKKLKQLKFMPYESFILCALSWGFIEGEKTETLQKIAEIYCDNFKNRLELIKRMIRKETKLLKMGFIEFIGNDFVNNSEIMLSDKTIEMLFGKDKYLFVKNEKIKNLVREKEIDKKVLYYNDDEIDGIKRLSESLSPKNFTSLQKRLAKKKFPTGLAILLEGGPGTGKTETAYQLAKEHGRDIIHVDISQSKSLWFGESEKIVKKIFTDYEKLCKRSKIAPILLFNEADAIISKRIEGSESSVSQTENAIQNIILEEMEQFKGILIATTNLATNFDPAFERRFLFKIHFKQPDVTTKAKIWKSKLPSLSIKDSRKLSTEFNFSGGQIDNIVRKVIMSEVINNSKPGIDDILIFCREELPSLKRAKLGFVV